MTKPLHFDFVISNPRHHLEMALSVIACLHESRATCRILSLCELRGFATPAERIAPPAELFRIVPWNMRRSPASGDSNATRRWIRALAWHCLMAPRVRLALRRRPDLAVLPNDDAYPYDRIAGTLRQRRIPFLMVQEGIRFPLPGGVGQGYGCAGASAIAAWGQSSAAYFRGKGVAPERIRVTGNPRAGGARGRPDAETSERARSRWDLGPKTLLLCTNPIEDQGFCTRAEKLTLIRRFARGIAPLFDDPAFCLAVKLHGREAPSDYEPLFRELPADRFRVLTDAPLSELFAASEAAVVLASTVGLEALAGGLSLGVLEIPGFGFQYDYVQSGAAVGLSWQEPMAAQVAALFRPSASREMQTRTYLRRQLDSSEGAARRIADLAIELAGVDP